MKFFHSIAILLRRLITGGGLVSYLLLIILLTGCGMNTPEIKIFALKYGESLFPEKYMYQGSSSGKDSQFTWLCYYVEYGSRKILIDTGFINRSYITTFRIKNFKRPSEILKDNGIQPESITDIIITHGHFDHAGGIADYPHARIIISSTELEEIKKGRYGSATREDFLKHGLITQFADSFSLDGIFTIKKIGGHSPGSSVVYLESGKNMYCFTGDEVYSEKSLVEKIPNGSTTDIENNIKFISGYDMNYIPLTFHNPELSGQSEQFIRIIRN